MCGRNSLRRLSCLLSVTALLLPATTFGSDAAASNPIPADGATIDGTGVTLAWTAGRGVREEDGHIVFVGTSPAEVEVAFVRNHPNVEVHRVSSPMLELSNLAADTTYYWRVDQVDAANPEDSATGDVWSFTTGRGDGVTAFADDFAAEHDYLADGVAGTGWDGFIGRGQGETADRIDAAGGVLTLASANGRYEARGGPLGPLLYRTVTGDFKVTVRIADYQFTSFNNGGIMARAAGSGQGGRGESWISIDYFPLYSGIYARMADGAQRHEVCANEQGRESDTYLQMERAGNLFFLRHSPDGVTWTELSCSPIRRPDLAAEPLQVGLFQCTYSGNRGQISFADLEMDIGGEIRTARPQSPEDGAEGVPLMASLVWIPGSGSEHQDLYFGTSREAVAEAYNGMTVGTGVYLARLSGETIRHRLPELEDGVTYYWRVDAVTGDEVHRGAIHSFTTHNRMLENFAGYGSVDELSAAWRMEGGAKAGLQAAGGREGGPALRFEFDNTAAPRFARFRHTFSGVQDWMDSAHSFRWLTVHFKGDPGNRPDVLSLEFEEGDWGTNRTVVSYAGDPADLRRAEWTRWDIDLQELVANNPTFRPQAIKSMSIVVGNPEHQAAGGSGVLLVDEISLNTQRFYNGFELDPRAPRFIRPERFVTPLPFTEVTITGGLWRDRMDVNREVSIPHIWEKSEHVRTAAGNDSMRIENFRRAAGVSEGGFTGTYFNDSDVYKTIEANAYSLRMHPDPELEAYTDQVIEWIAGAQWEDGYLFTYYSLPRRPHLRWSNIGAMHELYCAGHLIEGAIAYYETTGKRELLDVAIRFADLIDDTFGPGKRTSPPGHQQIELALMKLFHLTGEQKYMDLSKFFVDQRGRHEGRSSYGTYSQDHVPFVEQEKGVGHSVRAGYLFIGATDIAMVNHDESYANALFRLWDNITNTKTYLTGGIGQPGGPEGFSGDYQLGNNCYAETCSGLAFARWNHRLHLMTGEAWYLDIVERTLYNNVLSALSHDGRTHYYTNPLSHNGHRRWEWPGHDTACCPPSLARALATIGGYFYTYRDNQVQVNWYAPSEATIPLAGDSVTLIQETAYPWDGDIKISVDPERAATFALRLRVPGWAENRSIPGNLYRYLDESTEPVTVSVNGTPVDVEIEKGYINLERRWESGDTIELALPMPVRRVVSHPNVSANEGLVAVERGPIVYSVESADHDFPVADLKLADTARLTATYDESFFNGAVTISSSTDPELKLIPNYLHTNRTPGWMRVWVPRE